jgi:hypothetical protein
VRRDSVIGTNMTESFIDDFLIHMMHLIASKNTTVTH